MAILITESEFDASDRVSPFDRAQANVDLFVTSLLTGFTISTLAGNIEESNVARVEAMKSGRHAQVTFINKVIHELETSMIDPVLFGMHAAGNC